jgi:hypothetical protein
MDFSAMLQRVVRAMSFDTKFFQELRTNTSLNQEALYIVIAVAVLSAIGAVWGGLWAMLVTAIMVVVGYFIWTYVALWVGQKFYNVNADIGQVQRAFGYAYAPQLLRVLGIIPCLGGIAALVGAIWSLALGVFAIRESMQLDTTKAIVVTIIGWVIIVVISLLLGLIGLGGAGVASFFSN